MRLSSQWLFQHPLIHVLVILASLLVVAWRVNELAALSLTGVVLLRLLWSRVSRRVQRVLLVTLSILTLAGPLIAAHQALSRPTPIPHSVPSLTMQWDTLLHPAKG